MHIHKILLLLSTMILSSCINLPPSEVKMQPIFRKPVDEQPVDDTVPNSSGEVVTQTGTGIDQDEEVETATGFILDSEFSSMKEVGTGSSVIEESGTGESL